MFNTECSISNFQMVKNAEIILFNHLDLSLNGKRNMYGEVQAAESGKDFIHKIGYIKRVERMPDCFKSYQKKGNDYTRNQIRIIYKETEELIAIIAKSVTTAKNNNNL